jgi:hypothetical protein
METYIPISDAIRLYNLGETMLHQWVTSGIIRSAMLSNGIIVNDIDIQSHLPRDEQPQYKKVAHLSGVPIGIREGGRKYSVPSPTISVWVDRGYIKVLGNKTVLGGHQKLIDEADLAYCAALYLEDPRQGRKLFNSDGTPYHKK